MKLPNIVVNSKVSLERDLYGDDGQACQKPIESLI